jgi:hypothetical protein
VLYNITVKFGTELTLARAVKIYIIETYTEVWTGKHLSDTENMLCY